ncbi:HNH endonuclease [Klebsiella sp. JB_Kp010]|uniref:HNH endonuclease n=1 Tax=Klebsiella TaxID=570 RepID=UPI001C21CFE1|nr:HNH endonuclease [Klebsiella variicola]MBU9734305.1 HNH endonuclease [Klebsiella variicola]
MKKKCTKELSPIVFSKKSMEFISSCNLNNHRLIWNVTVGKIISVKKEIRQHYLKYQKNMCAYCRTHVIHTHGLYWDIEHIIPKDKYSVFLFEPRNLALSCRHCNSNKSNKKVFGKLFTKITTYPSDGDIFSIIHPHYDKYSTHMDVYLYQGKVVYEPKSDKGRNTFNMCNLDRFAHAVINDVDDVDILRFINNELLKIDVDDSFPFSPREENLMNIISEVKSRIEKKYQNRDFV